jgi:signal transduction histidine kinase
VLDSGLEDQMEGFFVDLHGSKHWGDIRFIPEFGVSGQVNSVLTVARDITERKRMELRLEETQLLLRLLAQRNETLREDERKHLKRELHDELGQSLLALRMGLSMLDIQFGSADALLRENARRMIGTLDSTIQVVRDVVTSIRPSSLDLGIVAALEWLVEEYQKFSESAIRYELHVCEGDIELDDARATTIFRIVQESLTNIVRHAQASQVDITLARIESHYLLEVRDNGRGFDTGTRKEKSFGLVSIRERALALGGDVEIDSAPNRSTAIKVKIPIHPIASNPLSAS